MKATHKKREKAISRSKSKKKISRNASREALPTRQSVHSSTSNLKDTPGKKKKDLVQERE